MRKIQINAEELVGLLEKQAILHKEQGVINEKLVELDKERTKIGYKAEKIRDKIKPIIDGQMESFNLGEFEVVTKISLNEGQPEAEVLDMVEEYIKMLRENKENK